MHSNQLKESGPTAIDRTPDEADSKSEPKPSEMRGDMMSELTVVETLATAVLAIDFKASRAALSLCCTSVIVTVG